MAYRTFEGHHHTTTTPLQRVTTGHLPRYECQQTSADLRSPISFMRYKLTVDKIVNETGR
eukprot:m.203366 g.203366  ORF g.203366 m.203366 type:complete len:60 (+) comp25272_c0_seq1:94-273(+)